MTTALYFRIYATIPLLLPLASYILVHTIPPEHLPDLLGLLLITLTYSGLWGGIPYVLVTAVMLWYLRARPATAYIRACWLLPLAFTVLFSIATVARTLTQGATLLEAVLVAAMLCIYSLILGYSYVFIGLGLFHLLRRRGWIRDWRP